MERARETGTDEDDKCGIAIFGKARFDSIGVTGDWGFADSEVVDTVITGRAFTAAARGTSFIEILEGWVDGHANLLEGLLDVDGGLAVDTADA